MAILEYNVNLKSIYEMYPDAVTADGALIRTLAEIKRGYTEMQHRLNKEIEVHKASSLYLGYNWALQDDSKYPDYDDAVSATYEVVQGKTYNEVVTSDAVITLDVSNPIAVNILNNIDVAGTFYIIPVYRVTGY